MNSGEIEKFIKALIVNIGDNPDREGLRDTPRRFVSACEKLYSGYGQKPEDILTVFDDEKYDEINTIIFLTDGDWLNRQKNYRILEQWIRTNQSNIAFQIVISAD